MTPVNAIDRAHQPYLVRLNGVPQVHPRMQQQSQRRTRFFSLCIPYLRPHSTPNYSSRWQKFRMATTKSKEIRIGQTVADRVLALRSNDGSDGPAYPYVFGTAPGIINQRLRISAPTAVHALAPCDSFRAAKCQSVSTRPSSGSDQRFIQ